MDNCNMAETVHWAQGSHRLEPPTYESSAIGDVDGKTSRFNVDDLTIGSSGFNTTQEWSGHSPSWTYFGLTVLLETKIGDVALRSSVFPCFSARFFVECKFGA